MMEVVQAPAPGVAAPRPEPVAVQVLPEGDAEGRVAAYHMVVKRSYRFGDDGALRAAPARPLVLADRGPDEGDAAPTAACELVPPRPRCDVVVMGHCHPPRPTTECICAVALDGVEHRVRVVGDRIAWLPPGARRARFGSPRPFAAMPLDWSRSWGGCDHFDPGRPTLDQNPVGRGFWVERAAAGIPEAWRARADAETLATVQGLLQPAAPARYGPLPNLLPESGWPGPDDVLRPADDTPPPPMGFGWRGAHWAADGEPAGAPLDPPWRRDVGRAANRAPAPLQRPHPAGGAALVLTHMRRGVPTLTLELPHAFPRVYWNAGFGRAAVHVVLDTVLVEPDAGRLDLIWRGTLPMPDDCRPSTVMPRLLEVDGVLRRWAVPIEAPIPADELFGPDGAPGDEDES